LSNNEIPAFGYIQAKSVADAVSTLTSYQGRARVIAGGTDLLSQMKDNIDLHVPEVVVDITNLGLDYVTFTQSDGLRIGATTNVSTVETDTNVNQYFTALSEAATGHPPGIANQATVGGDVLQEVWCWYLRNNYDCWRNGGNVCYAAQGDNRYYQSIFGGNLCYAVSPGDLPPALLALGAEVTIQGPGGSTRTATIDQLMPGVSIVEGRVTEIDMHYNEVLTEVHIPTPPSGTQSTFYKLADRGGIDFALASVAVVVTTNGSTISSATVALGGVANKPLRARSAESALVGETLPLSSSAIAKAAQNAVSGATPLTSGIGNGFKVQQVIGAVTNALGDLT
jgi:xanthine dehydrogenase YagS FAD-binding subunit